MQFFAIFPSNRLFLNMKLCLNLRVNHFSALIDFVVNIFSTSILEVIGSHFSVQNVQSRGIFEMLSIPTSYGVTRLGNDI